MREGRLGMLLRAAAVLVALLASSGRAGERLTPTEPVRTGVVSIVPADPRDDVLETLVLEERYVEAFEHAVATLRSSTTELGPMARETLERLHRVGAVAFLAGDRRTAEETLDAVLDARRRVLGRDDPSIAETLLRRGYTARYKQERPLARKNYDEAWRILSAAGPSWDPLRAALEQAEADFARVTDLGVSLAWYRRAHARRQSALVRPSFADADNLTWLGWTLARMGRFDEADPILLDARAQLDALGCRAHTLNSTIDHAFADVLVARGREAEAAPLYRSTATRFETARSDFLGGFARRSCPLDGFDAVAAASLWQGRPEEAWRTLERSRGATFVDFAALGLWRKTEPATFRRLHRLRSELLDSKRALGADRSAWGATTWPWLLRSLELRAGINRMEMEYLARHRPHDVSLEQARSLLGPKEALIGWLEFSVGGVPNGNAEPWRSYGWGYVLRRTGPLVWVPLWSGQRSAGKSDFDWEPIKRAATWPLRVDPDPESIARLRTWTRLYVDPLLPHLQGVEHLVVEDTRIPLATLVGADGRFLGDSYDFTYTPSILASSLLAGRGRSPEAPSSVLSIAGPSEEPRGETVASLAIAPDDSLDWRMLRSQFPRDETPLDRLPRLRFAGLEATSIARLFPGATVLRDRPDLEHRLWDLARNGRIRGYDVVHVASHTLTDESPERCGLALEKTPSGNDADDDGLVDVEEMVLGWDLDADLVTLSGCETARAAGADRGELLGFAPAILATGARNVLSSLWPVDDRATTILMNRFYENVTGRHAEPRMGRTAGAMPLARALGEAQAYVRGLVDGNGKRRFEHPVYWAGFILMGVPEAE